MARYGVRDGLVMGVREIERFLEQWRMDARDLHRRLIPAPAPRERALRQAQEMARHMAAGPRMDRFGYGAGPGTRSAHHRTMGRRLRRGRACRLDVRAVRGFSPPALCETQQAELKAAVQELPAMAGIELANWTLRQAQEEGGPSVCLGAIQHQPEPQRLPELSAPVGVRLEASQEAAGQG